MNNCISKQAALVAVKDALMAWSSMPEWRDNKILEAIVELPPETPEKRTEERTGTHACDYIERQAAIDALENDKAELDRIIKGMSAYDAQLGHFVAQYNQVDCDIDAIKQLPPAELSTNLAEVGTDCISRQAAIDNVQHAFDKKTLLNSFVRKVAIDTLKVMPPAQPEIIRCKDCNFWTKQEDSLQGRCALMGTYPTGNWFCGNAERRTE